jgi:hypothetical protein
VGIEINKAQLKDLNLNKPETSLSFNPKIKHPNITLPAFQGSSLRNIPFFQKNCCISKGSKSMQFGCLQICQKTAGG